MRWMSVCTGQASTMMSALRLATPSGKRLASRDSTKNNSTPPTAVNQITGGSQNRLITNSTATPRMLPARLRP
jgi:hypothetical protein